MNNFINFPTISVVMSVYNGQKYLAEAIESTLNQNIRDLEFIIIDDDSTDNSLEIVQNYRAKDSRIRVVVNETNLGLAKSLNKGIALARGKYIARMDADDVSLPERFEKQVNFLENNPNIGVLGTNYSTINEEGFVLHDLKLNQQPYKIWWGLFFVNQIVHPSVMMRRSIFTDYDIKYLESLSSSADYDLWFQIIPYFDLANLNETLHLYRLHGRSISVSRKNEQERNAASILTNRTQQVINLELPDDYGAYLSNTTLELSQTEALISCRALSKLYSCFEKRYPGISRKERLEVKNDYQKKVIKIIDSQSNKLEFVPYIFRYIFFRVENKITRTLCSISNENETP